MKLKSTLLLLLTSPSPSPNSQNIGGQQEEEQGVVHYVQGEHYQLNDLRIWVIVSGLVGYPDSSSAHQKRSSKSKFLGLFLSNASLVISLVLVKPLKQL